MTFTQEQAEEIKKQLYDEIDKMPNADKNQIKEYVEKLNEIELEEFLQKNNINLSESSIGKGAEEKPIFQLINEGEIPSYKIAENDTAVAILEINPLARGHTIIVPKQKLSVEKIPKKAFFLAQRVARKIKKTLKPKEIKIETISLQNYAAINVIPFYKDQELKKEKANEEELKKLQQLLHITEEVEKPKTTMEKKSEEILMEISNRIPEFF